MRIPIAHGFLRKRLNTALDGIHSTRLGLVVAPAGSGKTTLLAAWAQQFPGTTAWYRADAIDAVRTGMAQCVVTALQHAVASRPSGSADGTRRAAPPVGEVGVEDAALLVESLDEPVLLVVDDVHELAETPAMAELERLLLLAPPNLYVVLGTRTMPPINLARLELPRPVIIVGDDLRFRSWEVEGLFRDFYAEPLRPDDAAALARRTDGWAAALQLFHLATTGREREIRSDAVSSLTGRSRYAQDYLSGQVLAGLPDQLREFMRDTCVFDVLTGARCDALLATDRAQRNLEELERRQALTTSDDDGATFRFHEVLRRHLETALLEERGDAATREWYIRAADVVEAEGAIVEALRARCRGADWTGVQRLLSEAGPQIAAARESDWAELLPPWLTQADRWVALAEARHLLDDGQLDAAEQAARRALELFSDVIGKDLCRSVIHTAATWRSGRHQLGRTWADQLRAATQRSPIDQAVPAPRLDVAHAELVSGIALLLAGDARSGGVVLDRLATAPGRDPRLALTARLVTTGFAAVLESYESATSDLESICSDAERHGFTWITRIARGLLLATEPAAGGVETAEELARDCAVRGDPWAAVIIRAGAIVTTLRRGDADLEWIDRLVDDLRALDAGVLEAWARCARAFVIAVDEHPEAEQEIRAAESFARSAGASGALGLVYAALAEVRTDDAEELRELARSTAQGLGLRARPWEWVRAPHRPQVLDPDTADAPPPLELTCFRAFRIRIDGADWQPNGVRPRARTLLRLLALHAGEPMHRERLAASLWGDLTDDTAMHNLQVTISSLRKTLSEHAPSVQIARDGDAYRLLLADGAHCDLREFETQLARAARARVAGDRDAVSAALGRALECYTGDLLPEDGAAEWVVEARDRYRTLAAGAAAMLAELELDRRNPAAAATAAARGVHIDRCHDGSWRALIRAHEQGGDLAAAEQAQRGYRSVLDSLGVSDED